MCNWVGYLIPKKSPKKQPTNPPRFSDVTSTMPSNPLFPGMAASPSFTWFSNWCTVDMFPRKSQHTPGAHPRQSPYPTMKGFPLQPVGKGLGVFSKGVLKQPQNVWVASMTGAFRMYTSLKDLQMSSIFPNDPLQNKAKNSKSKQWSFGFQVDIYIYIYIQICFYLYCIYIHVYTYINKHI